MPIVLSKDYEAKTLRHAVTGETINLRIHKDVDTGDSYDVYEDKDGNTVISHQKSKATVILDPETNRVMSVVSVE